MGFVLFQINLVHLLLGQLQRIFSISASRSSCHLILHPISLAFKSFIKLVSISRVVIPPLGGGGIWPFLHSNPSGIDEIQINSYQIGRTDHEEDILQTLYISIEFLLSQFINLGFGRNWKGAVIFWSQRYVVNEGKNKMQFAAYRKRRDLIEARNKN
ncbi:uncharacterized protein LOC126628557 isoform X2 [Malus sylvestris]|uniref:uncharacterized protein LOC126628557 isoform X2 n=1 Tax=Malus sylvestris TaxID=3752 RepID=UPI0021ABE92C|nr:uncharacterized protein LOC126628557 isoform X2 [Malus sylvestris]